MACQYKSRVWENGWCNVACSYCTLTQESTCEHNKQTNADRIRAMSDRELADFLSGKFSEVCCEEHNLSAIQLEAIKHNLFCVFMKWLRQPPKGE